MKAASRRAWVVTGLLALLILAAPLPVHSTEPTEHTFVIQAGRFAYTPGSLHVNPGDKVTIVLEAMDVVHGLAIDGYPVEISADPGQPARVSFVAGRAGAFRMRCSVTCGSMHPFMIGKLIVGRNLLLWRAAALGALLVALGLWKLWK